MTDVADFGADPSTDCCSVCIERCIGRNPWLCKPVTWWVVSLLFVCVAGFLVWYSVYLAHVYTSPCTLCYVVGGHMDNSTFPVYVVDVRTETGFNGTVNYTCSSADCSDQTYALHAAQSPYQCACAQPCTYYGEYMYCDYWDQGTGWFLLFGALISALLAIISLAGASTLREQPHWYHGVEMESIT